MFYSLREAFTFTGMKSKWETKGRGGDGGENFACLANIFILFNSVLVKIPYRKSAWKLFFVTSIQSKPIPILRIIDI